MVVRGPMMVAENALPFAQPCLIVPQYAAESVTLSRVAVVATELIKSQCSVLHGKLSATGMDVGINAIPDLLAARGH